MTDTAPTKKSHLASLNMLRGIAALMVCFWHFGGALNTNHASHVIFQQGVDYGQFGVRMFFVISGFVIPLSLNRSGYDLNNYFRFLQKRVLRLQIPFLCAVVITLVIMFFSYRARHMPFPENFTSILQMCYYLHVPADNQVFWTLAIEAQYYAFIGVFFFFIDNYPKITVAIIVPILVLLTQVTFICQNITLFNYLMFFLIGNVTYLAYQQNGLQTLNYAVLAGLFIATFVFCGFYYFLSAAVTTVIILYYKWGIHPIFSFFGSISYSLYLIHFPTGLKMINLVKAHLNPSYDVFLFIFTLGLVIGLAWLFCKFVEHPSEELSRKIKFRSTL